MECSHMVLRRVAEVSVQVFLRQSAWLRFLFLGLLLYLGLFLTHEDPPPPPLPTPNTAQLDTLRSSWLRISGTEPNNSEMQVLVRGWVDRELLFREALRLNLHLTDTLVWRRMVRNMQFIGAQGSDSQLLWRAFDLGLHEADPIVRRRLLQTMEDRARASITMPQEQVLLDAYHGPRAEEFLRIRRAFTHVFYSYDKRGKDGALTHARAFVCEKSTIATAHADTFPAISRDVPLSTEQQIAKNFGAHFATQLMQVSLDTCHGPMHSAYGVHWVYIHTHREERIPYEQVRALLLEDWLRAESDQALATQAMVLREQYQPLP